MPLIGATQGHHNQWTKGLEGSRRTLRNWTGGWTTAKSVAQEGRKVKPILPTTPSRSTDRKTSRTNLTSLKPAEDFFFFLSYFSPEFLLPFCPLPFLFLLPAFFYLFLCFNFCKNSFLSCLWSLSIPSSFLPFLFYFLFPSFPSLFLFFLVFCLFVFSFFSFFPPFSFSHRWDDKTWSAEKTRVRPC